MKQVQRSNSVKSGVKTTPRRSRESERQKEQLLIEQQLGLNVRIHRANEQQSALTKSLQVYQQGKLYLAEKEDELLRMTHIIDHLCAEVSRTEQEVQAWRDKLRIKELEVRQLETELRTEMVETEKAQREFETANSKLSEILREIEAKSRMKSQEAVELEAKERVLKTKTEQFEAEKRELERKEAMMDGWEYDERTGTTIKESFAKLKAELMLKDAQIHSQMEAYQSQQSHLSQLSEALKREFVRISSEKAEAERHKAELDVHEQQVEAQTRQLEKMSEEQQGQIQALSRELEQAQHRKSELKSKSDQLSQQIVSEQAFQQDLELKLQEAHTRDEEISRSLAEATAAEEELRRKELELEQQEMDLVKELRELEKKEKMLAFRRDMEGEIELRLESLMMSEDVYNRRHSKEMDVLGDILAKLQKREQELTEQEKTLARK